MLFALGLLAQGVFCCCGKKRERDAEMEARFDLPNGFEKSDWNVFLHTYYCMNPAARCLQVLIRLFCAGMGTLMALAVVGVVVTEGSGPLDAMIPASISLLMWCGAIWFDALVLWISRHRMADSHAHMTVTIHTDGVTDQTGAVTTHYGYQAFYAVCYCRNTYLLFTSRRFALVLPERFREGAGSAVLKAFLEEKTGKMIREFK